VLDIPKGSISRGHGCGQVPHDNPPPPPPCALVSIEDLLATQNELMRVLMRNEANYGEEHLQHHRHQDMNTSYSDFLATQPPVFFGARDPLDMDDWLRITELKFDLLHYIENQKTLYATLQLRGLVGAWWASYLAALPANHHVAWDEFFVAFHGHHLSAGTIFQRNHSVHDYTQEFNNLAQYGGHHVDSDAKKAELYHKGLNI
jgi:hypothetical protein